MRCELPGVSSLIVCYQWLYLLKIVSFVSLGDVVTKRYLYPDNIPNIMQKEGSGGPRPVASQFHCLGGQYLTSYVSL